MNSTKNNLAVFTDGNRENESILFVHGFPFDHFMWDEQVKALSSDYFCIRYDIRGLGASPVGDGQYTMEMFVDDHEQVVAEHLSDKPVLCGLSMGGYISLRAMERIQDDLKALILCDTKSVADDNETRLKRAAGIKMINEGNFESFIEEFVSICFADDFINNHKEDYEKVVNRSKRNNPLGVKGCLLAMAGRTDTTGFLSEIRIPALVICGSEDKISPPDLMMSMADKIPDSEFLLIEGAGHMTPMEKARIVNGAIKKFLRKV